MGDTQQGVPEHPDDEDGMMNSHSRGERDRKGNPLLSQEVQACRPGIRV